MKQLRVILFVIAIVSVYGYLIMHVIAELPTTTEKEK